MPCSHNKSLPTLIRDIACGRCHGSCLRTPRPSSSSDDDDIDDCDLDFDTKQVILTEIRNRAMKAKFNPGDFTSWSLPPPAHRRDHINPPKKKRLIGDADDDDDDDGDGEGDDNDEASEASFFSVKSCFSRCSSRSGGSTETSAAGKADPPRTLEELMSCEGWPFGLFRRAAEAAAALPPLPSTPADSWMWHKRNL